MKIHLVIFLSFIISSVIHGYNDASLIDEIIKTKRALEDEKSIVMGDLVFELSVINELINDHSINFEDRFNLLIKERYIEQKIKDIEIEFEIKFTLFRYTRGIEVLKMLYEKILGLDHHFTSLRTFQDIQEICNPNSYPEFANAKEKFKSNTKGKSSIELPLFLENNPIVLLGYTIISAVFGEGDKAERTAEVNEIACLLDFTVTMHSDIKLIFYETDYLKTSNRELMSRCQKLFEEYTSVIDYKNSLDYCRNQDDWDNLNTAVDRLMMHDDLSPNSSKAAYLKSVKKVINGLEFNITKLISFIETYDDFVHQGEQYYQKFKTIINGYENKVICITSLPKSLSLLETEISYSIEKFKTAYNMAELQGSKLRDLLYGSPEDI